jgi:lysophospholipase L1-like esterase
MNLSRSAILFLAGAALTPSFAQDPGSAKRKIAREGTEWCDVWLPNVTKTDLPYALLIGDSITKGYYPSVEKALAGKVNCGRLATSACVADPSFLNQLEGFLVGYRHSVIHFNNGLHGFDYTEDEYREGYRKALELIRKMQPGCTLIVALTTPLKPGSGRESTTARVEARNRIATELAARHEAAVSDLFSISKDRPELFSDPYHYKPEGIRLQSEKVSASILKALRK